MVVPATCVVGAEGMLQLDTQFPPPQWLAELQATGQWHFRKFTLNKLNWYIDWGKYEFLFNIHIISWADL